MNINIVSIFVIVILASLAFYVNDKLNTVPVLKTVIQVVIVVVAVLLILQNMGLIGGHTAIMVQ